MSATPFLLPLLLPFLMPAALPVSFLCLPLAPFFLL